MPSKNVKYKLKWPVSRGTCTCRVGISFLHSRVCGVFSDMERKRQRTVHTLRAWKHSPYPHGHVVEHNSERNTI